jgi:uncharacterized membrane protein YcjF (UPF0283 family)
VAIFALGLVAVAALFVCFLAGLHDLPLWLNISAGVGVPLGLALGLFGLVREARADARLNQPATSESSAAEEAESDSDDPAAESSSASNEENSVKSGNTNSAPAARS